MNKVTDIFDTFKQKNLSPSLSSVMSLYIPTQNDIINLFFPKNSNIYEINNKRISMDLRVWHAAY